MPNAADTITIRDDLKLVTITNRIGDKYARKLLHEYFANHTGIKSGWEFWIKEITGMAYIFEVHNFELGAMLRCLK